MQAGTAARSGTALGSNAGPLQATVARTCAVYLGPCRTLRRLGEDWHGASPVVHISSDMGNYGSLELLLGDGYGPMLKRSKP